MREGNRCVGKGWVAVGGERGGGREKEKRHKENTSHKVQSAQGDWSCEIMMTLSAQWSELGNRALGTDFRSPARRSTSNIVHCS